MQQNLMFKPRTDARHTLMVIARFMTVLMLIAVSSPFLDQGYVRTASGAGTPLEAYNRCLQEYASMEDRVAFGRARPDDNLGRKNAECTALYNQLTSAAGTAQTQPANPRQAYERCLQEYASMEDRVAPGAHRHRDGRLTRIVASDRCGNAR